MKISAHDVVGIGGLGLCAAGCWALWGWPGAAICVGATLAVYYIGAEWLLLPVRRGGRHAAQ